MNRQDKNWKQRIDKLYTDLEVIRTKFIELEQEAKTKDHPSLYRALSAFRWSLMTPWQKEEAPVNLIKVNKISGDFLGESIAAILDKVALIADERERSKQESH